MTKKIFILLLFLLLAVFLHAQSAQKIDEILKEPFLTNGHACYLAGILSGKFGDVVSYSESLSFFKDLKVFSQAEIDGHIRLDAFSHLILKSSGIKGDLWYRVSDNPYYAFRYLKIIGIIDKNSVPSASVEPRKALIMLNKLSGAANEK